MLVYGDQIESKNAISYLSCIQTLLRHQQIENYEDHDLAVEVLIEYGMFESALADYLCPAEDHTHNLMTRMRATGMLSGAMVEKSWSADIQSVKVLCHQFQAALLSLEKFIPDVEIQIKPPEGYAYYSLYPEMYIVAADKYFAETHPHGAVCIGIRSIGTSLSSIVAARLENAGVQVRSYTVRPRGDYFDRVIKLSTDMEDELRDLSDRNFLIIDEGPGLSGSSFISTATKLKELGIPDYRIVFFPSWIPRSESLISEKARLIWPEHKKYLADFEEVWFHSGRMAALFPNHKFIDFSAGKWRSEIYPKDLAQPAAHPHHERRKYLCSRMPGLYHASDSPKVNSDTGILKFAGLGRFGKQTFDRARILAAEGFAPQALDYRNGFIMYEYIKGTPLTANGHHEKFLVSVAKYLDFIQKTFPAKPSRTFEEMFDMMVVNIEEACGAYWLNKLLSIKPQLERQYSETASAVDGRMLPFEWLRTATGFTKTDATDHHADHFFPGNQHIAWDIAGFAVEFNLDCRQTAVLIDEFDKLNGKQPLADRLPFYRLAYSAFRLGYCSLAADVLHSSEDGKRFRRLEEHYGQFIRNELCGQTC